MSDRPADEPDVPQAPAAPGTESSGAQDLTPSVAPDVPVAAPDGAGPQTADVVVPASDAPHGAAVPADAQETPGASASDEAAWLAAASAAEDVRTSPGTPRPAAPHGGAAEGPDREPTSDDEGARGGAPAAAGPDDVAATAATPPGLMTDPEPGERDSGEREPGGPGSGEPGPREPASSGWQILGRALRPRATRAQILAGVLCALLGFALAVQIGQTSDTTLTGMRQADLVRILDEAATRGDALERERADLADERDELLSGSNRRQAALDALRRNAETQGILTGRLPAEGPGVVATLVELEDAIRPVTMLNMLEELRNAGAEAIQLNDRRITASSAFTGVRGAVELDGVTLTAPYVWKVVGDPDTIAPAMQIPGGAFAEVRRDGGHGTVDRAELVEVSAIRDVPDPVHATPVPPESE